MEKNRKIIIVVTVLVLFLLCVAGTIYYFTEIKLDENGFNSHGIRELDKDRNRDWEYIYLGTYALEVSRDIGGGCKLELREPTYEEVYNDLWDLYYPDFRHLSEESEKKLDKYTMDELDTSWRDKYVFNNVSIEYGIFTPKLMKDRFPIRIYLNKNGTIDSAHYDCDEKELCDLFEINNYTREPYVRIFSIYDSSENINYISGSVERK